MKKIILLGIISLTVFLYLKKDKTVSTFPITPLPSIQPSASQSVINSMEKIEHNGQIYYFSYKKINNLNNLHLYSNFDKKSSSQDLIKENQCLSLFNAGFYSQDDQPLGWFVSDYQEISPFVKSSLFNGFISFTNKLSITAVHPKTTSRFGLQSGPLLIFNNKPLILKIINDEPRRRLIAIQTPNHELIFLVLIGADSLFSGPLLADTPIIVSAISKQIKQDFTAALNLDGGSASTFYTTNLHLEEFSYIGSYFCEN